MYQRKIRWEKGLGIGGRAGIRQVAPAAMMLTVVGGVQVYSALNDR
jgi:hypothetical protein